MWDIIKKVVGPTDKEKTPAVSERVQETVLTALMSESGREDGASKCPC